MRCHHHAFLLLLILVGIAKFTALICIYSTEPSTIFSPDSAGYIETARAIVATGHVAVHPETPEIPQIERTPGYPLFLATIFFFAGYKYLPVVSLQVLMSLGTLYLVHRLAATLFSPKIAMISAVLFALDFPSFVHSQKILTETFFTFTFTVSVITGLKILASPSPSPEKMFLHGTVVAIATLIRPITYYIIVVEGLFFFLHWKAYWASLARRVLPALFMLILPSFMLVGGWQFRNYLAVGSLEFSNVVGWNLLFWRGADIIARRDGLTFEEAQKSLGYENYTDMHPETHGWAIAQLNQRWKHEGMRIILRNPLLFLESCFRGAFRMMLATGWRELITQFLGPGIWNPSFQGGPAGDLFTLSLPQYVRKWFIEKPGWFIIQVTAECYLLIFYGSCLLSFLLMTKTGFSTRLSHHKVQSAHLFIWIILGYLFVVSVSVGPVAYFRFRIPMVPFLAIYAGHGFSHALQQSVVHLTRQRLNKNVVK